MQAVYQKMGDALQASGLIVFSLCQYGQEDVWNWGAKNGRQFMAHNRPASADHWKSLKNRLPPGPILPNTQRPGHWNDPDMLEVGNGGMTDDEYRTDMSMRAMLRSPLLAGNDVRSMSDATKAILLNPDVIALDQDAAGTPAKLLRKDGDTEIWIRPIERRHGDRFL